MDVDKTDLFATARDAELQPYPLQGASGGLLVTVHGGRILGIFLSGVEQNLLWTNPNVLTDASIARSAIQQGEWNLGGDRCWLAPELELHFRNPKKPSHKDYAVPMPIDPGRYALRHEAPHGLILDNGGEVENLGSHEKFTFETTRAINLCNPPTSTDGLAYVGYELSSELIVRSADRPQACYGLWQLMQIPPGGTIIIPTRSMQPDCVDYFRTAVTEHCQAKPDHISFPVTGTAQHKLGLRPADARGLMGYYRPLTDGRATLIIRQASIFPGATYADFPAHQPDRRDIALQFYNDGGDIGGFGEMEYHAPAAVADNFFRTRDVSRTWCFAGPAPRVQETLRTLLDLDAQV